jgi:hypothetical protein
MGSRSFELNISTCLFGNILLIKLCYLDVSEILKNEPIEFEKKLGEWLPRTGNWKICWRATRDGWAASTFHSNCDGKSPTITIVQVINNNKKYVFGGYATAPWNRRGKFEINTGFPCCSILLLCSYSTFLSINRVFIESN